MNQITVKGDAQAEKFCLEIAEEMVRLFGVSKSEAIGRINKHWSQQNFVGPDTIYHRDAEFWANTIYYEARVYWWLDWWMAKNEAKPKPYP